MSAELVTINNAAVIRDSARPWRWLDAFGSNVTKWEFNPYTIPLTATTAISNYTVTAVGTSPLAMVAGADGGALTMTTGGTENNGVQFQPVTEGFYFANRWPAYFGAKFSVSDATETDLFAGLSIADSSAATEVSDGIFFWKVDGATTLNFCTAKNNPTVAQSSAAVATMVADTVVTVEFYFDGTEVTAYVNGSEAASIAYSAATFPNDEYLTPLFAILTGETGANALTLYWAKALQIREA